MRDGVHRGTALAERPRSRAGHGRSVVQLGRLAPSRLSASPGGDANMKPYVVCHMNASVDGRILGSRWRPAENRMAGLFEGLHEQLGGGAWLIGRVTGSEYAKADSYPDHTDRTYPREPWFARSDAAA